MADTPGDLSSQPCRTTLSAPPDWEPRRLAYWMSTVASAGPNTQVRVGAFILVLNELGGQAGAVDPQAELMDLQRSFCDRLRTERPDVPAGGHVGCQESDDVRFEVGVYGTAGEEDEAAVRRMDRIIISRRQGGPPTAVPALGRFPAPPGQPPLPSPPAPPAAPAPSPLPRVRQDGRRAPSLWPPTDRADRAGSRVALPPAGLPRRDGAVAADRSRRAAAEVATTLGPKRQVRIRWVGDLQIVIRRALRLGRGPERARQLAQCAYPIPLVVGGLVLGLIPGIPDVRLTPDLVLLVFLPPLLYSSAVFGDPRALRADARVISLTAIGLVLATAAVVALIGHELIGLP